ncbi:hypothetical protein FRC09_009256 [Ceratobasidium sp. 395]|nr:hypothetical protein FRC09_009256 [Ceratobasidium sp. 395]
MHLETLSLAGNEFQPASTTAARTTALPDNAFPSLRHMKLQNVDRIVIQQICALSPRFRHLITATIVYSNVYSGKVEELPARSALAIKCLGRDISSLTDLTVLTQLCGNTFCLSWVIIDALKHMPLRRLRLGKIQLNTGVPSSSRAINNENSFAGSVGCREEIKWRDLLVALPLLEEFCLEDELLNCRHLRLFAALLQNLSLLVLSSIEFTATEETPSVGEWQAALCHHVTIRCKSYFQLRDDESGPDPEDISAKARYVVHEYPQEASQLIGN